MNNTPLSDKYAAYSFLKVVVDSDKFLRELEEVEDRVQVFAKTCAKYGTPIQKMGEAIQDAGGRTRGGGDA